LKKKPANAKITPTSFAEDFDIFIGDVDRVLNTLTKFMNSRPRFTAAQKKALVEVVSTKRGEWDKTLASSEQRLGALKRRIREL
jgi:hypothetical protein